MDVHLRYYWWNLVLGILLITGKGAVSVDFSAEEGSLNIFDGVEASQSDVVSMEHDRRSITHINKGTSLKGNDMLQSSTLDRSAVKYASYHWTLPIPIKLSEDLSLLTRTAVMEAIREYELLTCITFVNRTVEEHYIHIKPLEGCWSWIGIIGGEQEMSIGSYCWYMDVVSHEIMHALGFLHEQSRADRDLYLKVLYENMDESIAFNFEKVPYIHTDDQRVPYDYRSVMQYSAYAGTNNGYPTMVTYNPYFQNVIGQRHTFSPGDITKINRLYKCSDTSRFSYVCDFEDPDVCGYVINHYVGWTRQQADDTSLDMTSSDTLYPQSDATYGVNGKGHFMFFNGSFANQEIMWSPLFISKVEQQCLQFSFYIDLAVNSTAYIRVAYGKFNISKGAVYNEDITDVDVVTNYVPRTWNVYRRTIQAPSDYKLLLYATAGPDDVIAIDDVSVIDRVCDTSYFTIHNVSGVWDQYPNGTGFYSPLMYTEDGYGFAMSVYPNGNSRAFRGYMSLFFHLVRTPNVDSLSWPFHNRTIRIAMVDPISDVTMHANRFTNFETSPSGGEPWEKPVNRSINPGFGYSSLFSISRAMSKYVKNNALMFSIDVPVPSQLRELKPDPRAFERAKTTASPETTAEADTEQTPEAGTDQEAETNPHVTNSTETTVSTSTQSRATTKGETSPQPTVGMTQPPTTSSVSSLSSSTICVSTLLLVFLALNKLC